MSKIEVNTIEPQCGTTLTLGASGDTVALASGASQSGFGRAGSVDWQTGSIKTATFTATSGEGYFCNTTSGAFTVNLPSSPSAGDIVAVSDYAKTFDTNNLTMGRGGSNIEGAASDLVLDAEGIAMTFVYVDATKGWKVVGAGREADSTDATFIVATGGTETTCGNCKIHTFTGPGTFTVTCLSNCSSNNIVSYMVVAGGGSGGNQIAGGGGGGGFREVKSPTTSYTASPLDGYPSSPNRVSVTASAFPITVGAGGAQVSTPCGGSGPVGNSGSNSVFSTITSAGGGGGGGNNSTDGIAGGSGGGAGLRATNGTFGAGNTPPVTPPQGNAGGAAYSSPPDGGGGGGGATAAGQAAQGSPGAGAGGSGAPTTISGTTTNYSGGGGGGGRTDQSVTGGAGGAGGGGAGAPGGSGNPDVRTGTDGTANTGGGGGGGGYNGPGGPNAGISGAGGSGVVIIRYKYQ